MYRLKYKIPTTDSPVPKVCYTGCYTLCDIAIIHNAMKMTNTLYEPIEILKGQKCIPCDLTIEDAQIAFNRWCEKHSYGEILNRITRILRETC